MSEFQSLDPRVNRLPSGSALNNVSQKAPLDQFGTFEVFVQPKEGKPFQHEGIVHAPNLELAFVLAKEAFTRRFTCVSIFVTDTRDVYVSPTTEGDQNAYDLIIATPHEAGQTKSFEIFHLPRRGKQHVHAGRVEAIHPQQAMQRAAQTLRTSAIVYNIWAVPTEAIRFTREEEKEMWLTLPDKKFRDAAAYKAGDRLTQFLNRYQPNRNQ